MTTQITTRRDGPIGWITLDGEAQLNAISSATYTALAVATAELESDGATRVIVIHGAGRGFSAGADIAEINAFSGSTDFESFIHGFTDALEVLSNSPLPIIAAIHGVAFGGGLELAMACDLRIATADAKLGVPEAKLGVLPGAGGTQRLPRLVPVGVATEMLMLGGVIDGRRAYEVGLVNRVATDAGLLHDATALAGQIAAGAPQVFAATKSLLRRTQNLSVSEGIPHERAVVSALFGTGDGREGFAAFTERRPPTFTGA
ncbi:MULTISPECIES: enoyl-CoA hydratase/isomerase family protein [Mycolicibacter]|uniref:Probable enoyl-CoA hydratase EchA17 n=1 Tax=Mycolicibacter kumamotonensis TaxID=354243 RepID=A0A7K3L6J7_9MYCO|nr:MULTISPECIES: enoyl-CoA hydratase-related protein [Mycolicibacter]NDJ88039.1 enoyl-CoA hydratase/isomerase family protein [Mycolicibacter kumamotonensis]RAV02849.1 enoyl-CoA hydratase/isomerase family protein [Mycolicibacter senuensis]